MTCYNEIMENFVTGADRERVQGILSHDEDLLWCGKPQLPILGGNTIIATLMGLFITGIHTFVLCEMWGNAPRLPWWVYLFPVGFFMLMITLCVYMVYSYRRDMHRKIYALTDRRAIILEHDGQTQEYRLEPYMVLRTDIPEQGVGHIVFEKKWQATRKGGRIQEYGFMFSPEAALALSLLEKQLGGQALFSANPSEEQPTPSKYTPRVALFLRIIMIIFIAICLYLFISHIMQGEKDCHHYFIAAIFCTFLLTTIKSSQ